MSGRIKLENQRVENLKELYVVLEKVVDDTPAEYFNDEEEYMYDLCEKLFLSVKCILEGFEKGAGICMENESMTDKAIENLWDELADIPVFEDEEGNMCIDIEWNGWKRGTDREEIWKWFDEHHSKGVGWLMNERNHRKEERLTENKIMNPCKIDSKNYEETFEVCSKFKDCNECHRNVHLLKEIN